MPEAVRLIHDALLGRGMDLRNATWMIRDLGESVSAIVFTNNGEIIAGGWNGHLICWDADGNAQWKVSCGDRISNILPLEKHIIVTSGLEVVCISAGIILWQVPLEGSADFLVEHQGELIATSSVYDIEHGDFMEGAVWRISFEGEVFSVTHMDEKAWAISAGDSLVIGLGRPRCGVLIDGDHEQLFTESPVTCGVENCGNLILGFADGTVADINGNFTASFSSAIGEISSKDGFVSVSTEENEIHIFDEISKSSKVNILLGIDSHILGFDRTLWCGIQNSTLEVQDFNGITIASMECAKVNVFASLDSMLAVGFESGEVMVWESSLFQRRLNDVASSRTEHRADLAAKLRALRK